MPELLLFALAFTIICFPIWFVFEASIKWIVLDKMLPWETPWQSLVGSIGIQILQILGELSAYFTTRYLIDSMKLFSQSNSSLLFLPAFLMLRFVFNTLIGSVILYWIKKEDKRALSAAALSNFISALPLTLCSVYFMFSNDLYFPPINSEYLR